MDFTKDGNNKRIHVVGLELYAIDEDGKEYTDFYITKILGKYYAFPTDDGCMITTDKILEIGVRKQ